MKKLLQAKISHRRAVFIISFFVFIFLTIIGYFVLIKSWMDRIAAESYCSQVGVEALRVNHTWGTDEMESCLVEYKNR